MDRTTKLIAGGVLAVAGIGIGTGIAIAAGATGSGDDAPITGSAVDEAIAAALEHTGGGTVVETEANEGGAACVIEIRLDDGTKVEVGLDANLGVIDQATDDDGRGDKEREGVD